MRLRSRGSAVTACLGAGAGGKDGTARRRAGAAKGKGGRAGIRMEEVAAHCTPEDAWMVFGGKVYDVSSCVRSRVRAVGCAGALAGRNGRTS